MSVGAAARAWYRENWNPDLALGVWWARLADAGWAFPTWPASGGGRERSKSEAAEAEAARREAGAVGPPRGIGTFLAAPTILAYGTPAQIERYVPGIVRGRHTWCQLFSEPGAGSDLAGLATRAERDGDEWIVTGQKVWNSGAQHARYGILMARTDPDAPKHRGITYFLLDMDQPGVEVRPLREMTGDIAFNEVFLSEARVPDEDRLGPLGEGWRVGMTTLSHERNPDNTGSGSGFAFGGADLEMPAGEYAQRAREHVDGFTLAMRGGANALFDEVVAGAGATDDPVLAERMTRIATLRRVAKWTTDRGAAAVRAGGQPGPEVSTLKLVGAELGRQHRDLGLAAMGPTGMLWGDDTPTGGQFHTYAMFTPAMSIAGGSDEINRNIIGERVLGLPREPGEAELRSAPWSALPRN